MLLVYKLAGWRDPEKCIRFRLCILSHTIYLRHMNFDAYNAKNTTCMHEILLDFISGPFKDDEIDSGEITQVGELGNKTVD